MFVWELEPLLRPARERAVLQIDGVALTLDLTQAHERRYFVSHWFNVLYPQADIDRLLFERFVRKGDVVLDAGANIGYTALQLLEQGAQAVYCFEPVGELYRRIAQLAHPKLRVFEAALSDQTGFVDLFLSVTHNQGSTMEASTIQMFPGVFGERPPVERVRSYRLDDVAAGVAFDFMKVDIEGAEPQFFRGAEGLLSSRPPRVLQIEIYEPTLAETMDLAQRYFRQRLRALIARRDYAVTLIPFDAAFDAEEYWQTAPTYVFTNQ